MVVGHRDHVSVPGIGVGFQDMLPTVCLMYIQQTNLADAVIDRTQVSVVDKLVCQN